MTILTRAPGGKASPRPFASEHGPAEQGPVVFLRCPGARNSSGHEIESKVAIARTVAELMERPFAGDYADGESYGGMPYFVPSDTLLLSSHARPLGA